MTGSGFNTSDVSVEFTQASGSSNVFIGFQYFRCFGWIIYWGKAIKAADKFRFNTSDVSVELFTLYAWKSEKRRVSILQMFRLNYKQNAREMNIDISFNTSDVSVEFWTMSSTPISSDAFQYFRCFGWIVELKAKEAIKA